MLSSELVIACKEARVGTPARQPVWRPAYLVTRFVWEVLARLQLAPKL